MEIPGRYWAPLRSLAGLILPGRRRSVRMRTRAMLEHSVLIRDFEVLRVHTQRV